MDGDFLFKNMIFNFKNATEKYNLNPNILGGLNLTPDVEKLTVKEVKKTIVPIPMPTPKFEMEKPKAPSKKIGWNETLEQLPSELFTLEGLKKNIPKGIEATYTGAAKKLLSTFFGLGNIALNFFPEQAKQQGREEWKRIQPILQPIEEELPGYFAADIAEVILSMSILKSAFLKIPTINRFATNYPRIFDVVSLGVSGTAIGQLDVEGDTTFKDRTKQAVIDFSSWSAWALTGGIPAKQIYYYYPAYFTIGYTSSILEGHSHEDALIAGFSSASFSSIFRLAEIPQKTYDTLREQSIRNMNKLGADVSTKSSPQELKQAYYSVAHLTHPDKPGGSAKDFKQLKTAYDVLSKNPKELQKGILQELQDLWKSITRKPTPAPFGTPQLPGLVPIEPTKFRLGGTIEPMKPVGRPTPKKEVVKRPIDALTKVEKKGGPSVIELGLKGKPIKVTITKPETISRKEMIERKAETTLLKAKLRAEVKTAKTGYRTGVQETREKILSKLRIERQEITDVKGQITKYVKDNLPPAERGKAITMVRDAKTQQNLIKAFSKIDRWVEVIEKKKFRDDILKVQKRVLKSPSVAVDYKDKIQAILDEYELKGHTSKVMEKLESTRRYIEERAKLGEDVEIPRRTWKALKILFRQPFDEIPVSTLEGVLSEIKLLEHLGRTIWKSRKARYETELEALKTILTENVSQIRNMKKFEPKRGEELSRSQKLKNYIIGVINGANRVDKVLSPIDVLMDILDGSKGTYTGAHMQFMKRPLDYDFNNYLDLKDKLQDPIAEMATKLNLKEKSFNRIAIVATSQQTNGLKKLENIGITEKDVNQIRLTSDEQKLLDKMRKTMDDMLPEIATIMRDLYNLPVGKVKDYFPWMTDWKAMDEVEVFQRLGSQVEEIGFPTKKVEMGFTRERKSPGEQKIQLNAMTVTLKHLDNVAYLLSMGRRTKMLFEIVNSKEYGKAVGDLGQLLVLDWIDNIARKGSAGGATQIAAIDWLRKNISAGVLGFKLSSALIQWTPLIDGMGIISPEWVLSGTNNISTSKDWRNFIMQFPEMRERMGGETAIREMIEGDFWDKLKAKGFIPLQVIDMWTTSSVAAGAYQKKMAELGIAIDLTKKPNKEAMNYAQFVVRRTQATAMFKDVPLAISKGALTGNRSLDRAILQFQNFILFRWSRIRHDALRVGIETKDPKRAANVLFWILLSSFAAIGTRMGVNKLRNFIAGKEDEEDDKLAEKMMWEMAGTTPFLGNIYGSYVYGGEFMPILQIPKEVIDSSKAAIEGKSPLTRRRGLLRVSTSLLIMAGVPGALEAQQWVKKAMEEEGGKFDYLKETKGTGKFDYLKKSEKAKFDYLK